LLQTFSAVCRRINKNNNTHSSKVESTGSYKSRDSRWPSRRTYVDGNINNIKENLTEVWGEEIWPPSTPDCNPFDYFVWGVSKLRVNAKFHNNFKDLIQKMKELVGFLARDILAKACTSFRSRIEAVFTADGSFIGLVDSQYVYLQYFFDFNKIG
jgi:hypothetical protein